MWGQWKREDGLGYRKSPEEPTWDSGKARVRLRPSHLGSQERSDLSLRLQGEAKESEAGSPEKISLVLEKEHSRSITSCYRWVGKRSGKASALE